MIKLINILNEIKINKPGRTVYAYSSSTGHFGGLIVLNNGDIISDNEENNYGVRICRYREGDKEDEFWYIDKKEI